jgi:CRISPR type III-B/RAMP module-associated protein Cmr3
MMGGRWLVLEPLDTVVIRDGRAFDAGTNSAARAVPPTPATVAGAIGAAYGAAPGAGRSDPRSRGTALPDHVQGPIVALRGRRGWEARWPLPRDVAEIEGTAELIRLTPSGLNDGESCDLDGELRMFLDNDGLPAQPAEGWWGTHDLTGYLHHGLVGSSLMDAPWQVERRVGLARTPDRTAAEGMFYSAEHLRPAPGHGFAARCLGGPDVPLPELVNLGGRSRRAQLHQIADLTVPQPPEDFPGGRLLLYMATPAVFPAGGWRPDLSRWHGAELVAAAIGPAQVVTTATPRRRAGTVGGGLLMWAVPAGSVYYLQFPDSESARKAAEELHYDPSRPYAPLEQSETWLATAGFGLAFSGRWGAPGE